MPRSVTQNEESGLDAVLARRNFTSQSVTEGTAAGVGARWPIPP